MIRGLSAVLLIALGHQVLADPTASLDEVRRKTIDLDTGFRESLQQLFYKNRQEIGRFEERTDSKHAELQLFVEIAKIELSQYRQQRRALLVADDIIQRYFINTNETATAWLPKTACSVDYIVRSLIGRAVDNVPIEQEHSRKRMYFLTGRYDSTTDIRYHARNYYLRLSNRNSLADKANAMRAEALDRLRTEVLNGMSEADGRAILQSMDELIAQAEARYDAHPQVPESVDKVTRDIELTELEALRRTTRDDSFYRDLSELDRVTAVVTMSEVLTYENALILSPVDMSKMHVAEPSTNDLIQEINWRLHRLNWKFEDFITTEFFDAPKWTAGDRGPYNPMVLSAVLAESYALIHTAEKRMLLIVREAIKKYFTRLLGDRSERLSDPLVDNSYLVELILRRSFAHALEMGFAQTVDLRKQLYLMISSRQGEQAHYQALTRKFYKSLKDKRARRAQAIQVSLQLLRRYRNEVSYVLPAAQVRDTMAAVDRLINDAVKEDDRHLLRRMGSDHDDEVDPRYTLREGIGDYMFQKIMRRAEEARAGGHRFDPGEIAAVSEDDLERFEESQVTDEAHESARSVLIV